VKEEVQLLIDLQELDQHIIKGRKQQEQLRKEQARLAVQADKLRAVIDQLDEQIATVEAECGETSKALALEQENVAKAEARLPEIKTQKEYLAVLKEADTAKKQCKDLQEKIDASQEVLQELQDNRDEKQQQLEELQQNNDSRSNEIEAELVKIDKSLSSEDNKRERLAKKVPEQLRKTYDILLQRRNGVAIVEARRYTCLGCNMHLPPQFFNNMLKHQGLDNCPHCNRLLYIQPQEN